MGRIRCPRDFTHMQKNNAFCSICTMNYTAYAGVLNESLRKVGHKEPHYVLVVDYDEKYREVFEKFGFEPVFLSELAISKINELVEKYSAFELANVLKPFFLEWLLRKHKEIDKLVYLDTDIYVYSPLGDIFGYLENPDISVAITPHISDCRAHDDPSDYSAEKMILQAGLYNGGFYALKNDSNAIKFLNWQKSKLFNYGYDGQNAQMFVDQKILDFAPIFFEFVGVYKNPAYNVAHWNYLEHPIERKNNAYFVDNKRLVFFHFSQLKINKEDIAKSSLFNLPLDKKPVLQKMVSDYQSCLKKNNHEKTSRIPYGFAEKYKEPPISLVNPILAKSIELDNAQSRLDLYKSKIKSFENALASTKEELDSKKTELDLTRTELGTTESRLNSIKTKIDILKNELSSTKSQLKSSRAELDLTKNKFESTRAELSAVYSSRGWKTLLALQMAVKIIFPKNSLRRKMAVFFGKAAKTFLRLFRKIKINRSISLKPKKPRKINLKSKKIVYIGHSYHNKTKSTEFLIEYLKQLYDVKVILDESWLGKPAPDLSFIDESYLGVIFFQLLPPKEILENIKNDNIIYFPMYDQSGRLGRDFWDDYRGLKIANFSKTFHEKLKKWGFESMYVQYFPELNKFIPGNKNEAFFWQRLTYVNFNTIAKLFGNHKLKVHIHKAIDPDQQFVAPSREVEKKFHITYSDWFETREEMLDLIKQKGIYVAPREYEGIGMSFLEAMAMGKAVIAVNNPTMNEYIKHGKNGYLFDLSRPKKIDLSNIEQVQKNAYEFVQEGRKKWEKDKERIIDFIKKS